MELHPVLLALVLVGILLAAGKTLRIRWKVLQNFFIPASLIGGLIGLLAGKDILGQAASWLGIDGLSSGVYTDSVFQVMKGIPDIAITVIFAALFLGSPIPAVKKMWKDAGPHVSYGMTMGWGQYVVGLLLFLLILGPFFQISPMAGALIEISFQGGTGTAAGLRSTFESVGFPEGADLAMGLAASSIILGLVTGVLFVNVAVRKGLTNSAAKPEDRSRPEKEGRFDDNDIPAGHKTTRSESLDSLTTNLIAVFLAIGIGMLLLWGMVWLEEVTWGSAYDVYIIKHIPLFPLALVGGVLLQWAHGRFLPYKLIDRGLILRIQGFALDILIVAAIASISLSEIGQHIYVFLILLFFGMSWNIFGALVLAKKMMPNHWAERSIVEYGQSTAMTTTGMLLLQMVDPDKKTPAFDSFGYKQVIFEPFLGGGLFTAASLPLIQAFGPVSVLIAAAVLMILWGGLGIFYFGRK
ncbi:sodium/glutamate symporter [Paenibacillus lemnae]|uniref:Sodium:glutamate symporter n=1 Tax=Paenibacillus lemnae TaxID=1330551 RepID=A0A848M0L9_PAELE|nr:sodium/glutamate symporter [Paenibacillus lemnae]NMO94377.1 sodium:glutamate symporter [Paenibacillus lemnae]